MLFLEMLLMAGLESSEAARMHAEQPLIFFFSFFFKCKCKVVLLKIKKNELIRSFTCHVLNFLTKIYVYKYHTVNQILILSSIDIIIINIINIIVIIGIVQYFELHFAFKLKVKSKIHDCPLHLFTFADCTTNITPVHLFNFISLLFFLTGNCTNLKVF